MRALALSLGLWLAAAAGTAAAAQEKTMSRIFPYKTQTQTLDNGLKVILIPMPAEGLVAYWTVVRTGSREEYEKGRTGFAHFFEHMMFKGTESFPHDVYSDTVTRMGANANAYTTDDLTAYHLGITAEDLETVMRLESDRFQRLSYSTSDFETEAGAVYGEYRKSRMSPVFTLYETVHQTAFDVHTYGHTTMGYERDIKEMPKMFDYSRSFFARYYRPENVVLMIVGDIAAQPTLQLVQKHYGDWQRGYVAPRIESEPPQSAEKVVEVDYEGQTLPMLWLAYKVDRFDAGDRRLVAASLLAELAFGETSELYKKLVLNEQEIEFIAAELGVNRDPGLLDIYTRIKKPERIDYVLQEIDRVIARHQQTPVDAQRLADLKSRLKYEFLMNLDTPDRVASSLARMVAVTGGIEAVDQLYATYELITPADIQAAARTYLVPGRRTRAVLRGKTG